MDAPDIGCCHGCSAVRGRFRCLYTDILLERYTFRTPQRLRVQVRSCNWKPMPTWILVMS